MASLFAVAEQSPVPFAAKLLPVIQVAPVSSPVAVFLTWAHTSGKLKDAAPGSDAALSTSLPNLFTLPTRRNVVNVEIDSLYVPALVDTEAHISVMSNQLRCHLKKILAPVASRVIKIADGAAPIILGMCTAQITVAGCNTSVLFAVLEWCFHDLISSLGFCQAIQH